ncbi:MAG TPA: ABC transporter permease [Blastocatellia bacterium]|nr:ABC transporter permease [Blastocatellia bacterium]
MDNLTQDLRFGLRLLRKNPGFTAVAVFTLALSIGANAAIFDVVNGVLLKPLPYKEPDRIVRVFEASPRFPKFPISPANFLDYRERNDVFDDFATFARGDLDLSVNDRPERLTGMRVSNGFFHLLGFEPELGRAFLPIDEINGNEHVAVISRALWERSFGKDAAIIGAPVTLSGMSFTIIGVIGSGLQHVGGDYHSLPHGGNVDVWWPLTMDPKVRTSHFLNAIARLKPGITREQAEARMNVIAQQLEEQHPEDKDWRISIVSLRDEIVGGAQTMLLILFGAAGFVLLIACVNIANLLLATATARQKEIAVRTALGAGRLRLIRQMLTESLLIAVGGGMAGLLVARWGIEALVALGPKQIPRLHMLSLDWRTFAFALTASLLTGALFGLAPALQISSVNLNESLKEGGRGSSGGSRHNRLRGLLVIAEVSLAFVLLIGAGLLMRTFFYLQNVDPGFNPERVLTATLDLPRARYSTGRKASAFYRELIGRMAALPGVQGAAATSDLPWTGYDENTSFGIEGRQFSDDEDPSAQYHFATPDYFRTLGIPLLEGRFFSEADDADAPRVIVINKSMADRYWPDADAVGKRVRLWGETRMIAGIVGDLKDSPGELRAKPGFFFPVNQQAQSGLVLVVRTERDPISLLAAMRSEIAALDKELPLSDARTLEQIASAAVARTRFTMLLLSVFAGVALLLAAVGIYGVVSYSVTQRTHEIGIRVALGAQRRDVIGLVARQGMTLVVAGMGAGLAAALVLTRLMSSLLFGVSAGDPITFAGIAVLLMGVALGACFVPARRAMKMDPMVALRHE